MIPTPSNDMVQYAARVIPIVFSSCTTWSGNPLFSEMEHDSIGPALGSLGQCPKHLNSSLHSASEAQRLIAHQSSFLHVGQSCFTAAQMACLGFPSAAKKQRRYVKRNVPGTSVN